MVRALAPRSFASGELLPPPLRGLALLAGELLPPPLRGLALLAQFRIFDASGSALPAMNIY
jgi:hypothetical protein